MISNIKNSTTNKNKYQIQLRIFAITLHFYSPKAYEYVRTIFNHSLPNKSTIRRWYSSIDGRPGFTEESFRFLKKLIGDRNFAVALLCDEISIKQKVEKCGNTITGFVDMGNGQKTTDEAKQALVFMVSSLEGKWRVPIAYFLINGLSAEIRKALMIKAIGRLSEIGAIVVSLTLDGPHVNIKTFNLLGIHFADDKSSKFKKKL